MLDDYRQVVADFCVFVLEQNEEIQGVLVLSRERTELLLNNIAVLPRHKGKGIGKALMAFCEEYAQVTGCDGIKLYTHQLMLENIEIYKKLGYQETHEQRKTGSPGSSCVNRLKCVQPKVIGDGVGQKGPFFVLLNFRAWQFCDFDGALWPKIADEKMRPRVAEWHCKQRCTTV
ncbi:GNAT family N-acetyltransferase [Pseudomonas sp. MDT2-39-1]|uniref:GNAT family N-acetyltransferase n=1 Tax=Pseudomonas sp. BGI-2 TaxID=2528211 RepID=UPI00273EC2FC|nr:GNAT family N-acetyltransferase [Pseudomonas sp. BGI-2]